MDNIYNKKDPDSLRKSVTIQYLGQAARLGLADLKDLIPHLVNAIQSNPHEGGSHD